MYSPDESIQIQTWRAKCNAGTITQEELREALALLRRGRGGAHAASAASKAKKASKAPVDSDDLLSQLDL
jgi:alkylhydroperoxidase/carboxymuconolactone decarboxylase family protein YurZ